MSCPNGKTFFAMASTFSCPPQATLAVTSTNNPSRAAPERPVWAMQANVVDPRLGVSVSQQSDSPHGLLRTSSVHCLGPLGTSNMSLTCSHNSGLTLVMTLAPAGIHCSMSLPSLEWASLPAQEHRRVSGSNAPRAFYCTCWLAALYSMEHSATGAVSLVAVSESLSARKWRT